MTSKDLHIAIKRNDGVAYLLTRFDFSDEEELFEAIRKIVPLKAEEFIKTLKRKQKQLTRRSKTNEDEVENVEETIQNHEQPVQDVEEVEAEVEDVVEEVVEEQEESSNISNLEQLLEEEKELSSKICEIEGQHKDLVSKRRRLVEKLELCQKALKELNRLLHEQEANVTNAYSEFLECASQMEVLNEEKRQYMNRLSEIRNKIENLKKITIYVYENSSIEVENLPVEYIEDSEVVTTSRTLYDLPEAEELTVKEIKSIAKLLRVVEMIERGGYQTECIFDSLKVQKFWETVTSA